MNGYITLVGAGPGDPELLTMKALRALESADIVVFDRLVTEEIMAMIPRGVPKIYAGKSCKHKEMPQEEINHLLITLTKKYNHVVRLKGGDPFLFGRGGEEMMAARAAGIACDIIPGITSAQGCAAAAGIPLTHRECASGVQFMTGHKQSGGEEDIEETLVIYMGLTNIAEITETLMAEGRSASTPAAIIERGTTPQQRVFTTTLTCLPALVQEQKIESPSLVIVGDVVALADAAKLSHDFAAESAIISEGGAR